MNITRGLVIVVALLSVNSVARAQYSFEYNGQTIRIDPDRGTVSIPGVYDNTGRKQKRSRRDQDATRKQASPSTTDAPATAQTPANAAPAPAQQPPASTTTTPAVSTATATPAPSPAPSAPADVPQSPSSAAVPAPATTSAAPAATTAPAAVAAGSAPALVPAPDRTSPIGIWLTEEKEGKIRIELCGANLCGYALDAKSNQNREQILIDMRPGQDKNQDKTQDKKWSGRIFDPNTGSTYDSTIAMTGPDSLRVQGCAFGGMFCGGQTWTRVN